MNKTQELAKNTMIITIGKICTQFMSFFLMPLYTSVLSTSEYGTVDLVVTYTSLLLPIVLFQVDQALFRFLIDVRNDREHRREILSTCMLFGMFQCVMASVIFGIAGAIITIPFMWFLILNVLAAVWSNMMLQAARGLGDSAAYALGSFISAASQIAGNVVTIVVFDMGVYGMLLSAILANVITALFIFIKKQIYKDIFVECFGRNTLKAVLTYSIPLIPNALCWWALNASDRTIVMIFLGTSANGLLSVSHKFSSMYITLYNIFNLSWTESAAIHINDEDRDDFLSEVITSMFKLFMCAAVGIVASMPFVFPVLINENYREAYDVIPVFMLASMFNVLVGLISVIYVGMKKTEEVAKTSIYSGIINIAVHLILVKHTGLYAAAISTAAAFGIMAVYRYFDVKKYARVELPAKWIIIAAGMFGISCLSYYSNYVLLQAGVLLMIIVVSVLINRSFLIGATIIVKNKILAIRRRSRK